MTSSGVKVGLLYVAVCLVSFIRFCLILVQHWCINKQCTVQLAFAYNIHCVGLMQRDVFSQFHFF